METLFDMVSDGSQAKERIDFLCAEINRHTVLYYRDANPEISDAQFDAMMAELAALEKAHPELLRPDSPTQRVGADNKNDFEKYEHLLPMQSLENTYNIGDLVEFDGLVRTITGLDCVEYAVEAKIDGLAFAAIYEDGVLKSVATRGDGIVGDDITANARTIRSLPLSIPCKVPRVEVRGEIYMPKKGFLALTARQIKEGREDPFKNPRNAAAGSIKLKDPKKVSERPLDVLLYSLGVCHGLEEAATHAELTEFLRAQGFPAQPKVWICRGLSEVEDAIAQLEKMRHDFPFEMDGAVIKVNDRSLYAELGSTAKAPRWAKAYKYAPEQMETLLEAITVQVGRTGVLTPVAELRPVMLAGSRISRATLHNQDYIRGKDIRIGDHVIIEKAGEVIPAVVSVVAEKRSGIESEYVFPDKCPVCGALVERREGEVAVRCTNFFCPAQLITRVLHFASRDALNIQGIGDKVAAALVRNKGLTKPLDLFFNPDSFLSNLDLGFDDEPDEIGVEYDAVNIPRQQLLDLDLGDSNNLPKRPLGVKDVENIKAAINSAKDAPLERWLYALGIPGIGKTVASEIAKEHRNLRDLASSELVAKARRLYELTNLAAEFAPNSQAVKSLGLSARVAAVERYNEICTELETLGNELIKGGVGRKLKNGDLSFSCVVKPEAVKSLDSFFGSDIGKEFLADMERLGINPEGGLAEIKRVDTIDGNNRYSGKIVVITGSFHEIKRSELTKKLQDKGATVTTSVSGKTNLLIVGENPGNDKMVAARRLGIPYDYEADIRRELGYPPVVEQPTLGI